MRLFTLLFLGCFAFGTASSLTIWGIQLPTWVTNLFNSARDRALNKICDYLAKYPDRANTAIRKVNETLQENNRTKNIFVSTLNYLNTPANQEKLVGGTNVCPTFFNEIQKAIETDLTNAKENSASAKQKALDVVNKLIDELKNWAN